MANRGSNSHLSRLRIEIKAMKLVQGGPLLYLFICNFQHWLERCVYRLPICAVHFDCDTLRQLIECKDYTVRALFSNYYSLYTSQCPFMNALSLSRYPYWMWLSPHRIQCFPQSLQF